MTGEIELVDTRHDDRLLLHEFEPDVLHVGNYKRVLRKEMRREGKRIEE